MAVLWVQEFILVPYIARDEFKPAYICKGLVACASSSLVCFLFLFLQREDWRWGLAGIIGPWELSGKAARAAHPTEQPEGKKKRKKACVLEDRNGLNSVGLFPSAAMLLGVPESVASEVDSY